MASRVTRESLYLRKTFTNDERLEMGTGLAESYNRMSQIEEEEAAMKANIKNQKAACEQTIGMLSRHLADGFTMENVMCQILYDKPNVNEATYVRLDTGEEVKSRVMTEAERQQELDLKPAEITEITSLEASAENIDTFFGKPRLAPEPELKLASENADEEEDEGEIDDATAADAGNSAVVDAEEDLFASADPAAATEATKPEHDAAWEGKKPAATRKKKPPVEDTEPF